MLIELNSYSMQGGNHMHVLTFGTVIPLISFLCYLILLIILMASKRNRIARHYLVYIIAMIIWSLGSFLMKLEIPPSVLFWNRVLVVGIILFLFYFTGLHWY